MIKSLGTATVSPGAHPATKSNLGAIRKVCIVAGCPCCRRAQKNLWREVSVAEKV